VPALVERSDPGAPWRLPGDDGAPAWLGWVADRAVVHCGTSLKRLPSPAPMSPAVPPPPPANGPPGGSDYRLPTVDTKLRALVDQAEAGAPCPPVKVLTGAAYINGTPASSDAFSSVMQRALEEELWEPYRERRGKDRQAGYLQQMESLKPTWQAVSRAGSAAGELVLTLIDVTLWPPSGGDGLSVPGIRVPAHAVDAWWFAGAKRIPSKGNWFFGVALPLPNLG
jgi:hypothetical protein